MAGVCEGRGGAGEAVLAGVRGSLRGLKKGMAARFMANKLAVAGGGQKIILMAILPSPLPGTSEVRNQFLEPLRAV